VQRAADADDVEAIVGASKELIETVAKAVVDAAGGSYGSDIDLPKLASQALEALKLNPAALQGRPPLQRLSQSLISLAQAISELRNTDGTGHGRSARSNLDPAHALLIRSAADIWCRWLLATARRAGRPVLDELLAEIGGARVFSRGDLPAYLKEHGLVRLGSDDQRRLGLAVARRWSVNGTFVGPIEDVVEPLAKGKLDYPPAFCEGIVEGLVLDSNGYLRLRRAEDLRLAVDVGRQVPGHRREEVFQGLAERVEDAAASYGFSRNTRDEAIELLRGGLIEQQESTAMREALTRIAARLEAVPGAE
jgi:hypothetical protein